ncbi:MAG TPA: hypothetical protein DCP37_02415 [Dehalococcoidia bacterium]|nr:hypothetical protein [Dehalococcoidia bacterium]|tara:strand:+ start:6887 stop:8356 length:1470 start_codon:yes stop_codon:yes gene_type:complete
MPNTHRIIVDGEPMTANEPQSHLDADPGSLLSDLLRRRDVHGTLTLIAQAASHGTLPDHQLAAVVRFLLEREPEGDGRGGPLSLQELELCCELASSVILSPDMAFGVQVSDSAWSMAHRAAYQQLPDGEADGYVPRSLALYRQIAPTQQETARFDFEAAYEEAYGITIDQVWTIGHALWGWCLEHPGESFDAASLATHIGDDGIDAKQVESFLAIMACDYATFRSMLGVPSGSHPHFEPYNINPFRKYPILKLPDGKYLTPILSYLLRRITHGLYYDLIELDRGGFIRLVANSFSVYVGKLLTGQTDVRQLSDRGAWHVNGADATLVIGCITRPFGALSRSTGDRKHLCADLARSGGVADCVKRVREAIAASDAKRVIGLVVAVEDFYLGNGPFIQSVVNEVLEAQGQPPMDADIQLAHVSGLEALSALSTRSDVGLVELLAAKVDHADYRGLELDAYARYQSATLCPGQAPSLRPQVLDDAAATFLGS